MKRVKKEWFAGLNVGGKGYCTTKTRVAQWKTRVAASVALGNARLSSESNILCWNLLVNCRIGVCT